MRYLPLLFVSVIIGQDVNRVSDIKSSTFQGTECDDTEYRNSNGTPNWKNYGRWLSECDSMSTTFYDNEFVLRDKERRKEKAIQDSLEQIEIASMDIDAELDMDAMWDNTIWQEIEEIGETIYGEVEQVTSVAGVRGAEAEDEALNHLYYRRSMKGIAMIDLQKAYGKLKIKRGQLIKINPKHPKLKNVDNLLSQLQIKINKS
jgi:hypothetical protein|tara:strand:+ start:389 stop:997 length:609 start_codon:yes stop_codon:yes gene_type:complete